MTTPQDVAAAEDYATKMSGAVSASWRCDRAAHLAGQEIGEARARKDMDEYWNKIIGEWHKRLEKVTDLEGKIKTLENKSANLNRLIDVAVEGLKNIECQLSYHYDPCPCLRCEALERIKAERSKL